jgi:opacity protein-like surface antigen
MKTLKRVLAALVALSAISGAQAATVDLGKFDGESRYFGGTAGRSSAFADYAGLRLPEKVSGLWTRIPTASPSFADLSAGRYRWEITGYIGRQSGLWGGKMMVSAVPEADVWLMLLIGLGLIGYQLRRKQRSLKQPPFAA